MNVSQVLDAAADIIERKGWWDGKDRKTGTYCALMAITAVTNSYFEASEFAKEFAKAICIDNYAGCPDGYGVGAWNDRSTGPEVIAMLRAVAATERAREARMLPVVQHEYSYE